MCNYSSDLHLITSTDSGPVLPCGLDKAAFGWIELTVTAPNTHYAKQNYDILYGCVAYHTCGTLGRASTDDIIWVMKINNVT